MSTVKEPQAITKDLTEESISSYLQSHPDFFDRTIGESSPVCRKFDRHDLRPQVCKRNKVRCHLER